MSKSSRKLDEISGVFRCWNCGDEMKEHVACELLCENCGFVRDCSDP